MKSPSLICRKSTVMSAQMSLKHFAACILKCEELQLIILISLWIAVTVSDGNHSTIQTQRPPSQFIGVRRWRSYKLLEDWIYIGWFQNTITQKTVTLTDLFTVFLVIAISLYHWKIYRLNVERTTIRVYRPTILPRWKFYIIRVDF